MADQRRERGVSLMLAGGTYQLRRLGPLLLLSLVWLQPPTSQSTFRAGIDIVEADATVVDADGRPVPGLVAGDFSLAIDGQPRAITSVMYMSDNGVEPARPTSRPSSEARDPSPGTGRLILLCVDEGNISIGGAQRATQSVARLFDALAPQDRVGLASIPSGSIIDFTTRHDQVRAALARAVGRSSGSHGYFSIDLAELFAFDVGAGPSDRPVQKQVIDPECPQPPHTTSRPSLPPQPEQR